jgi:hypothetical protein
MACHTFIVQAGVGAVLARRAREIFYRTGQDYLCRGAGLFNGGDCPPNPDAYRLHVRHNQIGKELSGLPPQAPETAQSAHHFELGLAAKQMFHDARKRWGADHQNPGFSQVYNQNPKISNPAATA